MAGAKENIYFWLSRPEPFCKTGKDPGFFAPENFVVKFFITFGHIRKRAFLGESDQLIILSQLLGHVDKDIVGNLINSNSLRDVGLINIKPDVHLF